MTNFEKKISTVNLLDEFECQELIQIISQKLYRGQVLSSIPDQESMEDYVPVDVPIRSGKDEETGVLKIAFPFLIGRSDQLSWRILRVTPAAQEALRDIFQASLDLDKQAGRNPPKPSTIQ